MVNPLDLLRGKVREEERREGKRDNRMARLLQVMTNK